MAFTTNAGTSWSTPQWVHRGCATYGPRSVNFWNTRSLKIRPSGRQFNDDGSPFDPYVVMASVGHEVCCDAGNICGGFLPEEVEFGFAYVNGNRYSALGKYSAQNDGYVREQSRYLNFDVIDQVFASHQDAQGNWRVDVGDLYVLATLPTTTDGTGAGASPLNIACPSASKVDVQWRSITLDINLFNPSPLWVSGPTIDSVKASPLCLGTTKRSNSWLPALGHTQDNKLLQFAIGAPTTKGQRIQATELDLSGWPPSVVPGHYVAADPPSLVRNSEQYMPSLAYFLAGNIQQVALTWEDDRGGASDGAFGALLGVGNSGGERISNLVTTPTTLVAHTKFAATNYLGELQATHVGADADLSPQNSGFAGTTWKGNRVTFVNYQP
ncbi:hypothetical protein BH09MYX1_BH09MYX1_63470 [soil metagenome]